MGQRDFAFLFAFDLLELDGVDVRLEPIEVRKATLASIVRKSPPDAYRATPCATRSSLRRAVSTPDRDRRELTLERTLLLRPSQGGDTFESCVVTEALCGLLSILRLSSRSRLPSLT